jgi:hypothetical protein
MAQVVEADWPNVRSLDTGDEPFPELGGVEDGAELRMREYQMRSLRLRELVAVFLELVGEPRRKRDGTA